MMRIIRNLLWIDCIAGGLAGLLVLLFGEWLSRFYALPHEILILIGVINLIYANYSYFLAKRRKRPEALIAILVAINGIWAFVCLGLATYYFEAANIFGIGHLALEAIFVGSLAKLEWKWRDQLACYV